MRRRAAKRGKLRRTVLTNEAEQAEATDRDRSRRAQFAEGNQNVLRFEAMLTQLGDFPDKDVIGQLTQLAGAASRLLGAAGAKPHGCERSESISATLSKRD